MQQTIAAWLEPVRTAPTIAALESAFSACIAGPDGPWQFTSSRKRALQRAVEQRGWELVAQDPQGERVPRIVRKPHSFRGTTYRGQRYPSGTWQNGAGYRWITEDLTDWVQRIGEFADPELAHHLIADVLFGMPHRALKRIHAAANAPVCQASAERR